MIERKSVVALIGAALVVCSVLAFAPHGHIDAHDCVLCQQARVAALEGTPALALSRPVDCGPILPGAESRPFLAPSAASSSRAPPV
jgi:hypothetical protein